MSYNSKYTGVEVENLLGKAGTALQEHQDISGKQDKNIVYVDKTASNWVDDNTYAAFLYRCDIECDGVNSNMLAEVIFDIEEAISGYYAPVCETLTNKVRIYSNMNTAITIPTIIITK